MELDIYIKNIQSLLYYLDGLFIFENVPRASNKLMVVSDIEKIGLYRKNLGFLGNYKLGVH